MQVETLKMEKYSKVVYTCKEDEQEYTRQLDSHFINQKQVLLINMLVIAIISTTKLNKWDNLK